MKGKIMFQNPKQMKAPPKKCILVGAEGFGKTTIASQTPKPFLILGESELGYLTLVAQKRVKAYPYVVVKSFNDCVEAVKEAGKNEECSTIVIDTLNSVCDILQTNIIEKVFKGDTNAFKNYGVGYTTMLSEWVKLIKTIDDTGKNFLGLAHISERTKRLNPTENDFSVPMSALTNGIDAYTKKWSDAWLFGTFETLVDNKGVVRKGVSSRVVYSNYVDGYSAKNRFGFDSKIELQKPIGEMFTEIFKEIFND